MSERRRTLAGALYRADDPELVGQHHRARRLLVDYAATPGTVGDNTVIGADSVVLRNMPANVVAAGNPCRVIRSVEHAGAGSGS